MKNVYAYRILHIQLWEVVRAIFLYPFSLTSSVFTQFPKKFRMNQPFSLLLTTLLGQGF